MINSDEQVLNATISALKIFEKAKCRRNKDSISTESHGSQIKRENELVVGSRSLTAVNLSIENDSSDLSKSDNFERTIHRISSKDLSEYQNIIENIELINLMHSFYQGKKPEKKDENFHHLINMFKDITSPTLIRYQIDKLSKMFNHITIISENGVKLKQVLRSNVLNDFWKVKADYHKNVFNFFTLAEEVMSDVNQLITAIEESKKHNPNKSKNLHRLETKLLAELQENLDIITEFRDYFQFLISQHMAE